MIFSSEQSLKKMRLNILPTSMALASQAVATLSESGLQERSPTGSFSILAYGVASEGVNVFYSDGYYDFPHESDSHLTRYLGLAYVGDSSQWVSGSVTTDVTCMVCFSLTGQRLILY